MPPRTLHLLAAAAAASALLAAAPALAAPTTWTHPGVFVGAAQLALARSLLSNASSPVSAAFTKALASPYGAKTYAPLGPPADGVIDCGSYSNPDFGCSEEDSDASAAYLQLVLFALTDEAAYAANAVRVLDAYGAGLKRYNNSNAPLQAAWGASKWVRAAELAMHLPNVGWPAADAARFVATLRSASLPLIENESPSNGNWGLSMIEGLVGFAVLTEDAALFDRATGFWAKRVPAYFFNYKLDGNKHRPAPFGSPSWYDQAVFDSATSGVAQETCRDEGHTSFSVAASTNAAETALLQGVDLYGEASADLRLATAFEFNAHLLLPGVKSPSDLCGGRAVDVASGIVLPTYEVAHARLAQRGFAMPNALQHIQLSVRTEADPVNTHMAIYETLTHGGGVA